MFAPKAATPANRFSTTKLPPHTRQRCPHSPEQGLCGVHPPAEGLDRPFRLQVKPTRTNALSHARGCALWQFPALISCAHPKARLITASKQHSLLPALLSEPSTDSGSLQVLPYARANDTRLHHPGRAVGRRSTVTPVKMTEVSTGGPLPVCPLCCCGDSTLLADWALQGSRGTRRGARGLRFVGVTAEEKGG